MKPPFECNSLDEIRVEIDHIDRLLISLVAQRFEYVKEVVKYRDLGKKTEYDHSRYVKVLDQRAEWAYESGLDGETIKNIFKMMIDYFIEEQKQIANKQL